MHRPSPPGKDKRLGPERVWGRKVDNHITSPFVTIIARNFLISRFREHVDCVIANLSHQRFAAIEKSFIIKWIE